MTMTSSMETEEDLGLKLLFQEDVDGEAEMEMDEDFSLKLLFQDEVDDEAEMEADEDFGLNLLFQEDIGGEPENADGSDAKEVFSSSPSTKMYHSSSTRNCSNTSIWNCFTSPPNTTGMRFLINNDVDAAEETISEGAPRLSSPDETESSDSDDLEGGVEADDEASD